MTVYDSKYGNASVSVVPFWSDYYNGVYTYVYTVPIPNDGDTILEVKVLNTETYIDAYRA